MAWASVLLGAAAAPTETYPSTSKPSSERQVADPASHFETLSLPSTPTHSVCSDAIREQRQKTGGLRGGTRSWRSTGRPWRGSRTRKPWASWKGPKEASRWRCCRRHPSGLLKEWSCKHTWHLLGRTLTFTLFNQRREEVHTCFWNDDHDDGPHFF